MDGSFLLRDRLDKHLQMHYHVLVGYIRHEYARSEQTEERHKHMRQREVSRRYVIFASTMGYIVYDRMDRVQIGSDVPTVKEAQERIKILTGGSK
jgi:hypothetical protein